MPSTSRRGASGSGGPFRYRLEILGRNGWFTPAASGVFSRNMPESEVTKRLTTMLASYYPPEPNDRLVLTRVERPGRGPASVRRG